MSERHKRKPWTSESAFVRLPLSHTRSEYAVYLLLNNLLQKKQSRRQTSEELHLLLSSSEHVFKIKAFHHTIVRKCLFRSFPLPLLMEARLESFWNFPQFFIFVLKRTALSAILPLPQSFAEVSMASVLRQGPSTLARSRVKCACLHPVEFILWKNVKHKNHIHIKQHLRGTSHRLHSDLQGDLKVFTWSGPLT